MALNKISLKSVLAGRFMAAALGGLLLSASFAPLGWGKAAWIAPGLILFSALGVGVGQAFRIGFVAGLVHFLSSLYWLLNMPFTWHSIPLAPGLGWLALSAYCALYPAIWVWLCWKLFPGKPSVDQFLSMSWLRRSASQFETSFPRPSPPQACGEEGEIQTHAITGMGVLRRVAWAFMAGTIWTALEFIRGTMLTGFPWNFVGASQYEWLPLIQVAAITGIYGVSFLVVWSSVSLWSAILVVARRPAKQSLWATAGLPLLAVAGVASFGAGKLNSVPAPAKELKVALIQPGIPQTEIWDSTQDTARFQTVVDLSEQALASNPQLLLWPESAVPDLTPENQEAIARLVGTHKTWLVFCAGTGDTTEYFNSALLCNPEGGLDAVYHKRRLVIFGEYIPLVRWFPFLKWLTPVGFDLTSGERPVDFDIKNPSAKMSVLICFEDMFPQEAREHVGLDTDFLINLSNDGWFGHGAEQWQQAASAIFRAIENGVPLLRCTNDGLTCWADAQGRVRQIQGAPGNVYGRGFIIANIPLRAPDDRGQTFYNRHGDWFAVSCCGIGLGWLAATTWVRRRSSRQVSNKA